MGGVCNSYPSSAWPGSSELRVSSVELLVEVCDEGPFVRCLSLCLESAGKERRWSGRHKLSQESKAEPPKSVV
jgi:hypothetical protein